MTSFVQNAYPSEHPGVVRFGRALGGLRRRASHFEGSHGAASLLCAALVSALLVVLQQVINTWSNGHLLAAWMLLWLVAFVGMVLLAVPTGRALQTLRAGHKAWEESRRQDAEDERAQAAALQDARLMASLMRIMDESASHPVRASH